jgi:hypothetical protein
MSLLDRREALKVLLGGLLQTAGTVVLASSVLPARAAQGKTPSPGGESAHDIARRADQVAEAQDALPGDEGPFFNLFVNGAFRKAGYSGYGYGGGGFRNGGFANGSGGGAFRNGSSGAGAFGNGGGSGFRNGGSSGNWKNGGWIN